MADLFVSKRLMLAAAVFAALGLAACDPKQESRSSQSTTASEASGKPLKTLTIGTSSLGTTERYLPWLETGREGWLVLEPIYESLIGVDPHTGAFTPRLVETYDVDDSGKVWHFTLRKDVQFHSGYGELTSEDVEFSFQSYISDRSVAGAKLGLMNRVERLEILGRYEFKFHLKVPDVTFLGQLSNGQFGVASKKYVQAVGDAEAAAKPVGSGPYRLVEHKRQEMVAFEAVSPHWRRTPDFARLVLRRVPDQAARLAMLRSGEIDLTELPYKLKREAESAGLGFFRSQGASLYHVQLGGQMSPNRLAFDGSVPWVGDANQPASIERALKVRKALNLAVDKKAIIDAVFEGEGTPGIAPYFAPGSQFVPVDLNPYPYDPTAARQLLAEAGYPLGFAREIEMLIMPWPGRAEMADVDEVVAGFWERNLGLKVRRRPTDYSTYAQQIGTPRKTSWVTWAHGYTPRPIAEPIAGMETWLMTDAARNSAVESPIIDALAHKIRANLDTQKRMDDYHAMARVFYDGYFAVPIASVHSLYAYNPKVLKEWPLAPGDSYISGYEHAVRAQ